MELGLSTFGEVMPDNTAGNAVNAHKRMQQLLAEAKLADELGLDVFAVGEHHRPDFIISAPEVVLAGMATITKNIKLSSAVTVLSSTDPVRTFQNFATLDLLSNGRAEIMAGRGSFIESFPLFGQDLNDYNELFSEKLAMLMKINESEKLSWKGMFREPVNSLGIYPRPIQEQLPIWIAVGGTPESMARAGALNLPVTLAMLGGQPEHFLPLVELFRNSAAKAGHDVSKLQFALNAHAYIADDSQQAADELWPTYEKMMNRIGKERGWSTITRQQFEASRRHGPLLVSSPQEVADKIIAQYKIFGNTRYLAQIVGGDIPHEKLLRSIELFATKVAPLVRKACK
jgi:probable LLM family oxidoreductase